VVVNLSNSTVDHESRPGQVVLAIEIYVDWTIYSILPALWWALGRDLGLRKEIKGAGSLQVERFA